MLRATPLPFSFLLSVLPFGSYSRSNLWFGKSETVLQTGETLYQRGRARPREFGCSRNAAEDHGEPSGTQKHGGNAWSGHSPGGHLPHFDALVSRARHHVVAAREEAHRRHVVVVPCVRRQTKARRRQSTDRLAGSGSAPVGAKVTSK